MNIQKEAPRSGEANQSKSKADSTVKIDKRKISKLTQAIMSANKCSRSTADRKILEARTALGFTPKKGVGYSTEQRKAILAYCEDPTSAVASLSAGSSLAPVKAITPESSFDEIRDQGRIHHEKTTEHALAFCGCVAALKAKCEISQGGSDFGKRALEYWGLGSSAASRALTIGTTLNIPKFGKVLPSSMSALEAIAKMPEDRLEKCVKEGSINPGMTAKDVSNLTKKKDPADESVAKKTRRKPEKIVDVADESESSDDLSGLDKGEIEDAVIVPPDDPEAVEVTLAELQAEDKPDDAIAPAPIVDARCDHITLDDFSSKEKKLLVKLLGVIGPQMLNESFDGDDALVLADTLSKLADLLGGQCNET